MKITSGKREDIMKERDEYLAQKKSYETEHLNERRRFDEAESAIVEPIQEYLEQELSYFRALQFEVRVSRGWALNMEGLDVNIRCNEHSKFNDDSALSWNFDVKLEYEDEEAMRAADMNHLKVVKETGSWSGLKATTPAQLKSLRQSVDAIQMLNDIDWLELLNKQLPNYTDYFKATPVKNRDNEFSKRLMEADLEALVGTNKLVKVQNFESSGYRGQTVYLRLIRETPAQYVCNIVTQWELDRFKNGEYSLEDRYTQRVKKSNVVPITDGEGNLDIVEV